ncbi:MAG: ATPase, T2SS/T4P/T4SS family, partial [Gemmatimonadetes bacterium]|nr:ATPase, T2SS/T4P/T4SS family [Gemmatimonadota bacterium]
DSLGLNPDESARIKALLDVREGVVLVTGPTGSGKTTTLYSMLRTIQARGVNIVTVEDPVEYRLQGIVQVQVNEKAGLTFVSALRSILRQDPDVILIGEIRDRETANIAVQASLTGHLVLSTLHTIDASSSVTRLADIGIEPYKIAAAIKGIVAQRLMRRLCHSCRARGDHHVVSRCRLPRLLHDGVPRPVLHHRSAGGHGGVRASCGGQRVARQAGRGGARGRHGVVVGKRRATRPQRRDEHRRVAARARGAHGKRAPKPGRARIG